MKAPVAKFFLRAGFWLMGIATTAFFATLIHAVFVPEDTWPEFLSSPAYGWGMMWVFIGGLGLSVLCALWLFAGWLFNSNGRQSRRLLDAGLVILAITIGGTGLLCVETGGAEPNNFDYFIEFMLMSGLILIPLLGLLVGGGLTLAGLIALIAGRRKAEP